MYVILQIENVKSLQPINRFVTSGTVNPNLIDVNNKECITSLNSKTEQNMTLELIYSVAL